MRVPTLDGPSVTPAGAPGYTPKLRAQDTSVEQGLQAIEKGAGAIADGAELQFQKQKKAEEEAQKKADALRDTESQTALRHRITNRLVGDSSSQGITDAAFDGREPPTGFLSTQGTEASAQSAQVLDDIEKDRQEIAKGLNERQRATFLERSASTFEDARARVEGHTAQQFKVAQVATADAAKQAALDSVAAGGDREAFSKHVADVERSITELALSPEDAAADVAKFRKDVAVTTITAQLAAGDVETAAKQLELDRPALGTQYPAVKHQVDQAMKGAEKVDLHAAASAQVTKLADELRNKGDGYVTERALRDAVKRPPPGPAQEAFDKAFEQQSRLEHEKLQAAIQEERNNADRADRAGAPIPPATVEFLMKYDAKYLKGIDREQRAESRAWRAQRDGSARDKREAAQAQARFDAEVEQLYRAELVDNPNTNHETFVRDLLAEREGDLAVSPLAKAKMKREGAEAMKGAGSKASAAEKDFADDFGAELKAQMKPSGKGAKVDDELLQARKGKAVTAYRKWAESNGGKPLDPKAIAELKARLVKEATIVTEKSFLGWKYNSESKGMAVDQVSDGQAVQPGEQPAAAPTAEKTVGGKKFRKMPDGKWVSQ